MRERGGSTKGIAVRRALNEQPLGSVFVILKFGAQVTPCLELHLFDFETLAGYSDGHEVVDNGKDFLRGDVDRFFASFADLRNVLVCDEPPIGDVADVASNDRENKRSWVPAILTSR
ncbi:MAG: hypothetical protein JRJ29_21970 [Deltaproteobacteria bacterium]|nr:hypothetical protein [Deltaproteobacteria bacterium]